MLSRKEKFYTDDLWKGFDEYFSYDTYERLIASERKGKTGKRFHILPVIGLHQNPTWELIYILAINLEFIAYPQCQKEIIILHRY